MTVQGRILIQYAETWGTVCDNVFWDDSTHISKKDKAADMLCLELGYERGQWI